TTTRAPSRPNATAVAWPIPRELPVTRATRPASPRSIRFSSLLGSTFPRLRLARGRWAKGAGGLAHGWTYGRPRPGRWGWSDPAGSPWGARPGVHWRPGGYRPGRHGVGANRVRRGLWQATNRRMTRSVRA